MVFLSVNCRTTLNIKSRPYRLILQKASPVHPVDFPLHSTYPVTLPPLSKIVCLVHETDTSRPRRFEVDQHDTTFYPDDNGLESQKFLFDLLDLRIHFRELKIFNRACPSKNFFVSHPVFTGPVCLCVDAQPKQGRDVHILKTRSLRPPFY